MNTGKIYRIIDANLNRSREGLRVCEEVVRFILNDAKLTGKLKTLRHKVTRIAKSLPVGIKELLASRESDKDVGKEMACGKTKNLNYQDIFIANMGRVKESLRVLEELAKVIDAKSAGKNFQSARFEAYTLEKKVVKRLHALCDTG